MTQVLSKNLYVTLDRHAEGQAGAALLAFPGMAVLLPVSLLLFAPAQILQPQV